MIIMNYEENILKIIKNAQSIDIFQDGKKSNFSKNEENYKKILNNIATCFNNVRIEPAFGVSLHDLTVKETQNGSWIKLNFDAEQLINGMPFASLLFKLDEVYGLNLIREYNGRFDGRCVYLELNNLINLNKIIENI